MNRRKLLKYFGLGTVTPTPLKPVLSSERETKVFGYPKGVRKPKILSEKKQFEFLRHFDEELKKPHITPEKRKCHE